MERIDHIPGRRRRPRHPGTDCRLSGKIGISRQRRGERKSHVVGTQNHQIDLIVLDIMMPGEDGLTLCRQLRANPQQDIPVLMLTARTDDSDRILGLGNGG